MYKKRKLLIVVNVDWIFIAHRMKIALEAQKNGFEVIVATKDTGKSNLITENNLKFIDLDITRSGVNPFTEIKVLVSLFKLYRQIKPDLVYQVTMKPVIYGSIVSKLLRIKTVNTISGLGYNFTENRRGLIQKMMIMLMRWGFKKEDNHLIFENKDDYQELNDLGILNKITKTSFIKGVGVDLDLYHFDNSTNNETIIILLPTRMLWDKGVKEFVEAALLLKDKDVGKVVFKLCGMLDYDNREAVPECYLRYNEIQEYLEWIGYQEDMVSVYKSSDIVVLPSYREGLPTVLAEACAAGKPIVTTNAIGCKDCVEEGVNGYKVPVKSVKELADAIEKLIDNPLERKRMGINSRKKAENEFDQRDVIKKHFEIFEGMLEMK